MSEYRESAPFGLAPDADRIARPHHRPHDQPPERPHDRPDSRSQVPADARPAGRIGMREALRMEWIKLRSLRSTAVVLAVVVVASIALGVYVLAQYRPSAFATWAPWQRARFDAVHEGLAGTALMLVAFPILGAVLMTSEFSSGLIGVTLTAVPNRWRLLAAKALVLFAVLLVLAEAVTFTIGIAGNAVLTSAAPHAGLGRPAVVRALVLTGLVVALLGVIGLGLGAIIRHPAGAVAAVVVLVYAAPALVVVTGLDHGKDLVSRFFPMLLDENSTSTVVPLAHALSPWEGTATMVLYTAVTLGLAGWLLNRRDA